jgi:hypothetical protein
MGMVKIVGIDNQGIRDLQKSLIHISLVVGHVQHKQQDINREAMNFDKKAFF